MCCKALGAVKSLLRHVAVPWRATLIFTLETKIGAWS